MTDSIVTAKFKPTAMVKIEAALTQLKLIKPSNRALLQMSEDILFGKYNADGNHKQPGESWADVNRRQVAQFKSDLATVTGLDVLPFGPALIDLAWREAHSNGLLEVFQIAEDMAEAIYK